MEIGNTLPMEIERRLTGEIFQKRTKSFVQNDFKKSASAQPLELFVIGFPHINHNTLAYRTI